MFSKQDKYLYENGDSESQESQKTFCEIRDVDIDCGYAWVICFAAVLIYFNSWGLNSGFAVYFNEYENSHDYFKDAKDGDFSWVGGLSFGIGLILTPLINYIQCKWGTSFTIFVGALLQFLASLLASFSNKIWQLYLTQGVLQGFGLSFVSIPAFTIIPQFFIKHKFFASGLASGGAGLGGVFYNLSMQLITESKGVEWALRSQAIISFVLLMIAVLLIRGRTVNDKPTLKLIDIELIKCPEFYLLTFFSITCMLGYVIVLFKLAHYATSMGFSKRQATLVSAVAQIGNIFGRPLVGYLGDKFGSITTNCVVYLIAGILALAMWIPAQNYATVIVFAILEGLIMGCIFGFMGVKNRLIYWIPIGAASLFSPIISDLLTDVTKSDDYTYCSVFTGCCFLACSFALFLLRGCVNQALTNDSVKVEDIEKGVFKDSEKDEALNQKHPNPIINYILQCFSVKEIKV